MNGAAAAGADIDRWDILVSSVGDLSSCRGGDLSCSDGGLIRRDENSSSSGNSSSRAREDILYSSGLILMVSKRKQMVYISTAGYSDDTTRRRGPGEASNQTRRRSSGDIYIHPVPNIETLDISMANGGRENEKQGVQSRARSISNGPPERALSHWVTGPCITLEARSCLVMRRRRRRRRRTAALARSNERCSTTQRPSQRPSATCQQPGSSNVEEPRPPGGCAAS